VGKRVLGSIAICPLLLIFIACSRTHPNFVAIDPEKRSDTWAVERADVDCKAQVGTGRWVYRWRLKYRADPEYVSCMQQKGFIEVRNG
jgi:hypothetical protein